MWVILYSWLYFCHWSKPSFIDHSSLTSIKLGSVNIMTKGNPPADTSKYCLVICVVLWEVRPTSLKILIYVSLCMTNFVFSNQIINHTNVFHLCSVIFYLLFKRNHCAYVIEKTVSFTVQDGAAPYVKAEYNKCSWGQKCPTLLWVNNNSFVDTKPLIISIQQSSVCFWLTIGCSRQVSSVIQTTLQGGS